MKKLLALTLALVSLIGCSKNTEKTSEDTETQSEPHIISSDLSQYENGCTYNAISGADNVIYFVDNETLEAAPLCAMPNCDHSTSSCTAKAIGSCPVIYEDYVYYFVSDCGVNETADGREFYIDSKLMRIKLENSEAETVTEFHDAVPDTRNSFVLDGDILYFVADDMNPQENEYGILTYSNAGGTHYLCSINLSTGAYTNYGSIYDGDKDYVAAASSSSALILGVLDNKLMLNYSFLEEEIPDEKYLEEGFRLSDCYTEKLLEFDLTEKTISLSERDITFINDTDTYGYYDKEQNLSVIHDNGKEYTLEGVRVYKYSAVLGERLWLYRNEPTWYDLSDKSAHEADGYTEVIDYHNGKYIVKTRGMNFKAITEEEL